MVLDVQAIQAFQVHLFIHSWMQRGHEMTMYALQQIVGNTAIVVFIRNYFKKQVVGVLDRVVKALDPRSRGMGFDSPRICHV